MTKPGTDRTRLAPTCGKSSPDRSASTKCPAISSGLSTNSGRSKLAPSCHNASATTRSASPITRPPSEDADDAIQLGFGVDQVDPLGGDPEAVVRPAQAVLDQSAPDTLALVTILEQDERRGHAQLVALGLQHVDIGDLVHRTRSRRPGVGSRVLELADADLEQPAIVVDDRRRGQRVRLARLKRNPVRRVIGEEAEPLVEPPVIEQPRLVVQELLDLGDRKSKR